MYVCLKYLIQLVEFHFRKCRTSLQYVANIDWLFYLLPLMGPQPAYIICYAGCLHVGGDMND